MYMWVAEINNQLLNDRHKYIYDRRILNIGRFFFKFIQFILTILWKEPLYLLKDLFAPTDNVPIGVFEKPAKTALET